MASVFKKARDRKRPGASWYIAYTDHDGVRRTTKGCPDKAATEALARKLESEAELRRRGVIDPKADTYRFQQSRPLAEHLADWKAFQLGKGVTQRHADEGYARVVKLVALAKAEHLNDQPEAPEGAPDSYAIAEREAIQTETLIDVTPD